MRWEVSVGTTASLREEKLSIKTKPEDGWILPGYLCPTHVTSEVSHSQTRLHLRLLFLSNTNNLKTVVWFQIFLSNINNLYTIL